MDREDLASAGYLALLRAFPQAPRVEAEARAYLLRRVAGALRDELRKGDGAGRRTRRLLGALRSATGVLESRLGRVPTLTELAAELNTSTDIIVAAQARAEASTPVANADAAMSTIAADGFSPADAVENTELANQIRSLLDLLSVSERRVIVRTVLDNLTLEAAGQEMGITKARVGQLRSAGLKRLRVHPDLAELWAEIDR